MTALATPQRPRPHKTDRSRPGAPISAPGAPAGPADPWRGGPPPGDALFAPADEALARRALRTQVERLETELGAQVTVPRYRSFAEMLREAPGDGGAATSSGAAAPRLLSLGELERERDRLASRLHELRTEAAALADAQDGARCLREEALLDPAAHPYVRVTNAEVGDPGCHDWHVRPRFGVLGMLMRWWRVKISSGCP